MRLSLEGCSIGYPGGPVLQRNVSLSVSSGEVCCVLGPNGCGKTTLVKTVLGILPPVSGRVELDGADASRLGAAEMARSVAYVAQRHAQPFPLLVRDVVMMGRIPRERAFGSPSREDFHAVRAALEQVGMEGYADVPYSDISGGELQLVLFARALAQEPKLLVLDEPTSALDYGNAVRVIDAVRGLARSGYGVLMVTHDPDHAFMCRARVALFMRGRDMVFGDAERVVTRRNIRDAYGVGVRLVEFTDAAGEVMRVCAPDGSSLAPDGPPDGGGYGNDFSRRDAQC